MCFFEGKGGGLGGGGVGQGRRGKAGGREKKGHKNCCFSPITAALRRFFFSLMKLPVFSHFWTIKKVGKENGKKNIV